MATRPPNDPPKSPDQLERGLRGPVGGVTRIGPRAFGLAFLVVCALLVAILYGLNRNPNSRGTQEAYASPPPPQPTNMEHFGQNEPIVATALPATPPPPLVLPPTAVPNLDQQEQKPPAQAPAAQAPSIADAAAAQREADEARARADEERKRRELAEAAARSPILANGTPGGGGSGVQLAFAGNSGADPSSGYAPAAGTANGGGSSGAGNGGNAGGGSASFASYTGGTRPAPVETHAPQSLAYLDGPSGQFRVQPTNVVLPPGGNPKDFLQAQRFAPLSPFEIVASSVIPASLITGIDSELPGLVTAQVREDVYDSKTGRYLLVPRGSRLVGLFNSQVQYGQTRVLVAWQRLIFPDTTSIDLLDMSGTDVQGGAGLSGVVDNHYGKIFGAALLTSILAVGAELAAPQSTSIFVNPSAGQLVSQSVGQQIAQTGTQIVQKDLNIPPTLHIARGYPFLVIVDRDIVLPGVYHGR